MKQSRTQAGNIFEVTDVADPRLEDYRDIRDRQMRGHAGRPGLFIGEQALVVQRMLSMPGVTKSVMLSPNWVQRLAPLAPAQVPVYVAPLPVMKHIAGFDIHRGVLAVGYRSAVQPADLDSPPIPPSGPLTVLVCEDITNIDNIGLLFRNAAAFGVEAVILSPACHDPLYRKSLRVSIGHALTVPFVHSHDWPADLAHLKAAWDLTLIGAALDERAVDMDSVPPPQRVGLVVGQEYRGLPSATLDLCDHIVKIPMAPGVDSLNVAIAAAVCLHRFSNAARV